MKKVLIVVQMGSEIRQFGHSGFVDHISGSGWQVLVGSRLPPGDWLSEFNSSVEYVPLPPPVPSRLYEQLAVILDEAYQKRRLRSGISVWRYGRKKPKNLKDYIRRAFQAVLSTLFMQPRLFEIGQELECRLILKYGAPQYEEFMVKHKLSAVVVTVPRLTYQSYLLEAAKQHGVPRFLFFHTNKDIVACGRFDHRFSAIGVWNKWMKEQLLAQNPQMATKDIHITGCSHFDPIRQQQWLIPELDLKQSVGVRANSRIVLYTAAGPGVVPSEERFVDAVYRVLTRLSMVDTTLVVRLNPMDDLSHLEQYIRENCPSAIVLRPDWYYDRSRNLCFQKKADSIFFNSLLRCSSVCVNIPSTLTIECALLQVPVINIGFDMPGPTPLPGSVRAFWDADFYRNIRMTNSAVLVVNPQELEKALRASLENPRPTQAQQSHLVEIELNGVYPPQAHKNYIRIIEEYSRS